MFRVTKAVCINPLAVIASHLIDMPLVCFSLKTLFDWVFWKTLHYRFSRGKASFCSSYFQELMLAIWSPVPPSALLCFAAALLDSRSAACSHSQGTRLCGSVCCTRIRTVSCCRKTLGWQTAFTVCALSIPQGHLRMVKIKIATLESAWKNSLESDCKIKWSHLKIWCVPSTAVHLHFKVLLTLEVVWGRILGPPEDL